MKLIFSGYGSGSVPTVGGTLPTMYIYKGSEVVCSRYEKNCSFICLGDDVIFGITQEDITSKIHIFSQDGNSLLDSRDVNGGGLCHISYIKKSRLLVGGCYETGNIFWVKVEGQKFSGEVCYHQQGDMQGRAHCVAQNADESLLFSANIMQDRIYCYKLTSNSLAEGGYLQLPIGIGPRHILPFDKNSYYVITEYSNEILLIKNGELQSRYSTLSSNYTGVSFGSSLCKSERFLYAANRGEDTIAVFEINSDFTLMPVGRFSCGDFPRHIALADNDSIIISANQHGNCFSIFSLDKKTGMSIGKIKDIPFVEPSFVMEYKVSK